MFKQKTALITLIGESSILTGDITTKQSVRVDGRVYGNITADNTIMVSIAGEIEGDLTCLKGKIIIEGKITGDIIAESIQITGTGKVTGKIETSNISIENGAVINSNVVMKIINKA